MQVNACKGGGWGGGSGRINVLETSAKEKKKKRGGGGKKTLHLCNCRQNTCKTTALIYDGEKKINAVHQNQRTGKHLQGRINIRGKVQRLH